jgi:Na+/phosphate symporter
MDLTDKQWNKLIKLMHSVDDYEKVLEIIENTCPTIHDRIAIYLAYSFSDESTRNMDKFAWANIATDIIDLAKIPK